MNKSSKVSHKIVYIILFILFISTVAGFLITHLLVVQFDKNLQKEHDNSIKTRVFIAFQSIKHILDSYEKKEISKTELENELKKRVKRMTYEDESGKNYVFFNRLDGTVLARPFQPELEGTNQIYTTDSKGDPFYKRVSDEIMKKKDGVFVSYYILNPETGGEELKRSYFLLLPNTDLYIGTGSYVDKTIYYKLKKIKIAFGAMILLIILFSIPVLFALLIVLKRNKELSKQIDENINLQKIIETEKEHFKTIFHSIGDAVIATDINLEIIQMNNVAEKLTGYQFGEIKGKKLEDIFKIINSETGEICENPAKKVLDSGLVVGLANHTQLISKTGEKYHISDSGAPIKNWEGEINGVVLVFRDVTIEYNLQKEAEEKDAVFKTIFEKSPFTITISDANTGKYLLLNPSFEKNSDISISEALGKTTKELGRVITESDSEIEILETIKNYGFIENKPAKIKTSSGYIKDIYFSAYIIKYLGKDAILSISVDVSEIKKLQQQLHHAQKMDAIGQLSGGVAHDFNNMLGGILGAAELLELEGNLNESQRKYLEIIIKAGGHASNLVSKLLTFARKGKVESTPVNIHKSIESCVEILKRTIDKKISINLLLNSTNYTIIGDNSQIMNIFLNLGINSSHAMQNGGKLNYSTRAIYLEKPFCDASPFDLTEGDYILIEVEDSGCGISMENIEKIFDPFFTTKEQGKGTGLGLAAVYGSIIQHKGAITVYSEINKGTTFHIYLPLAEKTVEYGENSPILKRGSGVILVVDDEEIIRITAKAMLEYMGYQVITAIDGLEGIDVYKRNQNIISLVILDMIMPKMSGEDCFYKLKDINPNIKVILSSGFSREADIKKMLNDGLKGFMKKPFHSADLSDIISNVISGKYNG
ncbi:cache domain-containing protein [bacterium]|nr:cache domain-containing protein [bacterium]